MIWQELMDNLKTTARAVDPACTFHRGRRTDTSLKSITAKTNLIYVEDNQRSTITPEATFEEMTIPIAVLRQDSTSSEAMTENQEEATEESREEIFAQTHTLARKFIDYIYENTKIPVVNNSVELVQVTRALQGTFTGWGLSLKVLIDIDCDDLN